MLFVCSIFQMYDTTGQGAESVQVSAVVDPLSLTVSRQSQIFDCRLTIPYGVDSFPKSKVTVYHFVMCGNGVHVTVLNAFLRIASRQSTGRLQLQQQH